MATLEEGFSDFSKPLLHVTKRHQVPMVSMLLQMQEMKLSTDAVERAIEGMECLKRSALKHSYDEKEMIYLMRLPIDPNKDGNYVAVSYTWQKRAGEDGESGRYYTKSRSDKGWHPSKVRNVVLDRSLKYADYRQCEHTWIDQECIDQDDAEKKNIAIQTMDSVYKESKWPIALLSHSIRREQDLELLADLLRGLFVNGDSPPTLKCTETKAEAALKLIYDIIDDAWWTRAWTFQEDYRAGTRMCILIPHARELESSKRQLGNFGKLVGELCVKSTDFRREVTRFCMAYKDSQCFANGNTEICNKILSRACKYNEMLDDNDAEFSPMSPKIIGDLAQRDLKNPYDMLAIIANVCDYHTRLNTKRLRQNNCSPSIAILALFILNGEIFKHLTIAENDHSNHTTNYNITDLLSTCSIGSIKSSVKGKLTFAKNCRFSYVKLTAQGFETTGHLWSLGKVFKTGDLLRDYDAPWEDDSPAGLDGAERNCLQRLIEALRSGDQGSQYLALAEKYNEYLREDERTTHPSDAKHQKDCMARDIINAIKQGKPLRLACLWGDTSHSGLFVNEDIKDSKYVFTSWGQEEIHCSKYVKYVSLSVDLQGSKHKQVPRLFVNNWARELMLFGGKKKRTVVFPWPEEFFYV